MPGYDEQDPVIAIGIGVAVGVGLLGVVGAVLGGFIGWLVYRARRRRLDG